MGYPHVSPKPSGKPRTGKSKPDSGTRARPAHPPRAGGSTAQQREWRPPTAAAGASKRNSRRDEPKRGERGDQRDAGRGDRRPGRRPGPAESSRSGSPRPVEPGRRARGEQSPPFPDRRRESRPVEPSWEERRPGRRAPSEANRSQRERTGHPRGRERAPRPEVPPLTGPNAFVDLGVPATAAAVLAARSITEPTPIQALAIPAALAGQDVLGRGRTGSGKTLAFGLPMITRLAGGQPVPSQPRGLVLTPTRELAMQVADALQPVAAAMGLRTQIVMGGAAYDKQIRGLERADIVVATPGRLVDLLDRSALRLDNVRCAVIDEADHLADLGFLAEIDAIMSRLDQRAQVMLFSATLDDEVDRLVGDYLHEPMEYSADPATATVTDMVHHIVLVDGRHKDEVTNEIALQGERMLAFVRTQLGAERLAGQLDAAGVRAAALHGGMKQGQRTRTLADFRAGRISALVATDVAARGIHVDGVGLVLHVDAPHGPKDYLHRSGRTARAGARGTVISLGTNRQARLIKSLTSQAGVEAEILRARPGDRALLDLLRPTG